MDDNSNTFTIMPMGKTIPLKAGEKTSGTVKIINQDSSKDPFSFRVTVAPYGVIGEGYDADLVTTTEQTQLANWISIETPTGTLAPGESTEVSYTIVVPENAPGGGQYAALVVSSNDESTNSSSSVVNFVYEMASILYGEVEGETIHGGSIISHSAPTFSTSPKVAVTAELENSGNIHEHARTILKVTNSLSGEEIFSNEEAETPSTEIIMPGTHRQFINNLENLPSLGIITVKESIDYLGENSTIEQRVIICPLWFLILVAFTLISIIAAIVVKIRNRRYTRPKTKSEMHL